MEPFSPAEAVTVTTSLTPSYWAISASSWSISSGAWPGSAQGRTLRPPLGAEGGVDLLIQRLQRLV